MSDITQAEDYYMMTDFRGYMDTQLPNMMDESVTPGKGLTVEEMFQWLLKRMSHIEFQMMAIEHILEKMNGQKDAQGSR